MMFAHNWGRAEWWSNPELPPTRWHTLEVVPPDDRLDREKFIQAIDRHNAILARSMGREYRPYRGTSRPPGRSAAA